jgi:hypothetical protein
MDELFTPLAWATYLALLFAASVYAAILAPLRPVYEPDWTWATVVLGNSLIIVAFAAQVALGVITTPGAAAVALLIDNIAAGVPVIVWQVRELTKRHAQLAAAARARR